MPSFPSKPAPLRAAQPRRARDGADTGAVVAVLLALFVYSVTGFFIPSEDYRFIDVGSILAAIFLAGLLLVAALGGKTPGC